MGFKPARARVTSQNWRTDVILEIIDIEAFYGETQALFGVSL